MKSLSQYIIENIVKNEQLIVNEGGNAVKCDRIPAEMGMVLFKEIEQLIRTNYKGINMCVLGSVGKKKPGDSNGDIDIAITVKDKNELQKIVDDLFPDCEQSKQTFGISIGYKYDYKGQEKIAQVDFMIEDDLDWAAFRYHSPNFINNESLFKGAVRNQLLSIVIACVPTVEPTEKNEEGMYITRWKHTYNQNGIFKQFLDYRGKKGLLKTPKKIKELETLITKNKHELAAFLFHKPDLQDFNSAESIWKAIHSSNFKYPELIPHIETRFLDEVLAPEGLPVDVFRDLVSK